MLLENNSYPMDRRVSQEAVALVDAGYRVSVICPRSPGQPRREQIEGVSVYRFPAPPGADGLLGYLCEYGYATAVTFLLSGFVLLREGFDVVHAHNPPDTLVFVAALHKAFGKRFVYDHHDLSPEMYRARFGARSKRIVYRALAQLERLSCRLADRIIATNQSYAQVEMRRGGVPEDRITVVRNGPNLDVWRPPEPGPTLPRAGLAGSTLIGYGGVTGFQDGVEHLLTALRHLIFGLGRTDVRCVIAGDGDAMANLRILASELGLDDHVRFTGWLPEPDLVRHLTAADICVEPCPSNPYTDRSTMMKIMNYMALAKPIVAFDLPEHRFTAQESALYVRPNDEIEFAKALAQLMDDPKRRQCMGAFGRRRVEQELAWCYSVPNLLAAYQALSLGT
jgi:glycosyltransferase involved in cell wall biosynthesis